MKLLGILLALGSTAAGAAAADTPYSTDDFGGSGLLQMPTARMFDAGEAAFFVNRTAPYSRFGMTLQPLDWFQGNFRYTNITNYQYDPSGSISSQHYKDKSFDFKLRLLQEDHGLPQIAVGFRDIGGTGLFSGEYLVASKRLADVDVTVGMAWGYTGARGDVENPLSWAFGKKFDTRPTQHVGGSVNTQSFFRGSPAFFGGLEYQTPWKPLALKLEVDGNDYQHEPFGNNLQQNTAINAGAVYRVTDFMTLQAAYERGNTAMFGITFHENYRTISEPPKFDDPAPEALLPADTIASSKPTDWDGVARRLHDNAGYRISEIAIRPREIVARGEQEKFFTRAEGVGRAARILNNQAGDDIDWITVIDEVHGVPIKETTLKRDVLQKAVSHDADMATLRRTEIDAPPYPQEQATVYRQDNPQPFSYGLGLGYKQNLGGPDNFLLYQVSADLDAEYRFRPNLWWSGTVSGALFDNFDQFKYDAPSNLPRVRTDLRKYLVSSDVTIPTFQLNYTQQFDHDVYAMAYAGLLESMYGGVGGEILYRPFGERWAIGMDLNWVRQRAYEQDFDFRSYRTVTGHITTYWQTGIDGLLVSTSIGHYLAKDNGVTVDVSRAFENGVRMGAWATLTSVSRAKFGEGSFDKGIYISVPFDLLLTSSNNRMASLVWNPLTRDGGARLTRPYYLYGITDALDLDQFHYGFHKTLD